LSRSVSIGAGPPSRRYETLSRVHHMLRDTLVIFLCRCITALNQI
jgi:hypothetical protein